MAVTITKPEINLREKLKELDFETLPFQKMPSGSVIQVKHGFSETEVNSTSSGEVSLGLSITISPTSSSSSFLIIGSIGGFLDGDNRGFGTRIKRNSTIIKDSTLEAYVRNENQLRSKVTSSALDSPNTVSDVTYEVLPNQFSSPLITYNEDNGNRQDSQIIVMEIAG